ncbi:hypothetical protein CF326_g1616 [Tilletia indica]|nr:hypothetical protein CF326_g1616 [Tilletia indica]
MRFAALLSFTMAAMAVSAAQTGSSSPTDFSAAANTDHLPAQARQHQYHTMPEKVAEERSGLDYPGDVPSFITLARALTDDDDASNQDKSASEQEADLATFRELGRRLESQGTRVDKILGTSPTARDLLALIRSSPDNSERAVGADVLPDQTSSNAKSIASVEQQGDAPDASSVASRRRAQALGAQVLKDQSASDDNSVASASVNQDDMSRRAMGADVLPDSTESEHKGVASVQQSRAMGANVLPDDTASEDKSLASVQQARAVGANVLPDDTESEDKSLASVQQARDFAAQALDDNSPEEHKTLVNAHQENESRDVVPMLANGAASIKGLPVLGGTSKKVRGIAPLAAPKVIPAVKNNAIHLNQPLIAPKVIPVIKNNGVKVGKVVSLKRGALSNKSPSSALPLAKAGGGIKLNGKPVAGPVKKPLQLSLGGGPGIYQPSLSHILKGRDAIPDSAEVDGVTSKEQDAAQGTSAPDASVAATEARDVEEASTSKPKSKSPPKVAKAKTTIPLIKTGGSIKVAGIPILKTSKGQNVIQGSAGGSVYKPSVVGILGRDSDIVAGKRRMTEDDY